jgi:glycosyltransferase involved in cell wall biosynthesis
MPIYLDLNYFRFTNTSIDEALVLYKKNLGYLNELPKNYAVHYFALSNRSETLKRGNITYTFFKRGTIGKFEIPFDVHRIIKKINPNYIIVHGMKYGLYSCILKRILPKKTKILVQIHGYAPAPKRFKKFSYRFASRFVDGYLFTGKENASSWVQSNIFRKEKVFEVMEGGASLSFDSEIQRKSNSFLWVARLLKSKDPLLVLKGFSKFLIDEPKATLTMYYSTNELLPEIALLLNKNQQVKKAVSLKGFIDNNKLKKEYNLHQYFIQASHFEGSGYALLEAMSCGCVPIVSKIPPFDYMIGESASELRFSVGNLDEYYNALLKTKSINYQSAQQKTLLAFEKRLTLKAIALNIIAIFQQLDLKSKS